VGKGRMGLDREIERLMTGKMKRIGKGKLR